MPITSALSGVLLMFVAQWRLKYADQRRPEPAAADAHEPRLLAQRCVVALA